MCFGHKADSQGQSPGEDFLLHSFRENSRHSAILILQGMERKHNWSGFRAIQGSSPGRGMFCSFLCACWRAWNWEERAEGRWGVGFVHVLHRRSPTSGVPGRKLVRVVVLDLGPWFATQLCFLPAGVRDEKGLMTSRAKERFRGRVGFSHLVAV